MTKKRYYLDYLLKTDEFPQSLYHQAKHKMVKDFLNHYRRGAIILDAGCGAGNITGKYAEKYKLYGIDEQKSAIDYCKRNYQGIYRQSSLYKIVFPGNYFEAILLLDTIEHLEKPTLALLELKRVLKPNGKIHICTINYANPLWFVLENTWHRCCGGNCRTYQKEIHPTRYTKELLRKHCQGIFKEIRMQTKVFNMELFYIGQK